MTRPLTVEDTATFEARIAYLEALEEMAEWVLDFVPEHDQPANLIDAVYNTKVAYEN